MGRAILRRRSGGWIASVARRSDALDLESGVFTRDDPMEIARSLKHSAEASRRRKAGAFQSAMAMLSYHINRSGRRLTANRREWEQAKAALRELFRPGCE